MTTSTRTTAVAIFDNREQAQRAVQELKRMGFTESQIGVVSHDDGKHGSHTNAAASGETYAEEGAMTGLAAGAGLGALWGIGIAAGLALPVIGPVLAGGTLAAVLASAATGAAAASLTGALIGMGIPEEEAGYYESEFKSGRTLVTVKAENRYNDALAVLQRFGGRDRNNTTAASTTGTAHAATGASTAHLAGSTGASHATTGSAHTAARTTAGESVQLREEQLHVSKSAVEAGEVRLRKEVHTEHKTIEVPVTREEVVIERTPASGQTTSTGAGDIRPGEEIRIPVREEQVNVQKTSVVKEEVKVGKRKVQDTETVSEDLRKEDVRVETQGDVDVTDRRNNNKR